MDCAGCGELLADFLLDELPESEAVLVHEHLLICPACMKAYRELKGTGKALEAVASLQPISASEAFKASVKEQAKAESEKIVSKLSPDKRLRLEARREARHSVRMSRRVAPPRIWSPGLLVLALGAAVILIAILFWPSRDKSLPRVALGKLAVSLGKVDQFYKKENQTYTPVEEGKSFMPGDSFKTSDTGSARFDLLDGGSIFVGPATDVAFRIPQAIPGECTLIMDNGEIGVQRPELGSTATGAPHDWEVRSGAGTLSVAPSTHAYVHVIKSDKASTLEVSVLAGCVHVKSHDGSNTESLYAGQHTALSTSDSSIVPVSMSDERPPAWRADLTTAGDLSNMIGGRVKILSRHHGKLQLEVHYNHETPNQDWLAEVPGVALTAKDGRLNCPTGVRWKLAAPFAPPLAFELKLNADSRHDTSFVFAYKTASGTVAVDVSRPAVVLSVEEPEKLRRFDKLFTRGQPGAPESMILQLKHEGTGVVAALSTTGGNSKSIPIWKDKTDAAGELWFQALVEPLLLDEIIVTGTVSNDWLREK